MQRSRRGWHVITSRTTRIHLLDAGMNFLPALPGVAERTDMTIPIWRLRRQMPVPTAQSARTGTAGSDSIFSASTPVAYRNKDKTHDTIRQSQSHIRSG
jgi:hypothetical protein